MSGVLNHDFTLTINPSTGFTTSTTSPNAQQVSFNGLQTPASSLATNAATNNGPGASSWNDMYGKGYSPFGSGAASGASARSAVEFPFAEISTLYGADAKTAYQEALANTAVQRRMDDLKRSGINPVLAAQGQAADTVSKVGSVSGGAAASGAGSGSSYDDYSAGTNFSARSLNGFVHDVVSNRNVWSAGAALTSGVVMGATGNFGLGAAVYYGVNAIGDFVRNIGK